MTGLNASSQEALPNKSYSLLSDLCYISSHPIPLVPVSRIEHWRMNGGWGDEKYIYTTDLFPTGERSPEGGAALLIRRSPDVMARGVGNNTYRSSRRL